MSFWAEEVLRASGVGALFLLVFAASELWRRLGSPRPEWTRKLVHFGGGLVSLGLPWLVRSHWTVLALGALFAGIIVLTRRFGLLGSVHGVVRKSEGGLYFPVAVYAMFLLASHRPAFYLASMLTLVVSDALAALVGTAYGRTRYRVEGDRRSVEGSVVFFLASFLSVHLPLLLLTPIDRALSVLLAVQIALLVTFLEAVSLEGNDNLLVPIGTYLLLLKLTPQTAAVVGMQLVAQLAIIAALYMLVWRSRLLTGSGTVAASLFFYGAYSLGSPKWIVAPAVGLLTFALVLRFAIQANHRPNSRYQVLAVVYTTLLATVAVIGNNLLTTVLRVAPAGVVDPLYPVFLGALAGHLALLTLVFWANTTWTRSAGLFQAAGSMAVGAAGVIPAGLLAHPSIPWLDGAVAAGVPVLAVPLYLLANRLGHHPHERPWDGRLQAASVALAILTMLPMLLRAWY